MNKNLTILLLVLLPFCAIAQHSIKSIDSSFTWQHTYTDSINAADMYDFLKVKGQFLDCNYDGKIIYGNSEFSDLIKDHSKLAIYARYDVRFTYIIDFKEDMYRVKLTDFKLDDNIDKEDLPINDLLIKTKDGSLRTAKIHQRYYQRLHDALIKLFTYKKEENW